MRPTSTPRRKIVSEESPVTGVAGAGVCPDAREASPTGEGCRRYNCGWRARPQNNSSAAMFSAEQYRALHESAGLVNRDGRGQLSFDGGDRRSFLQGLLTNDIQALEAGSGCYAALLTANGRMVADMRVVELGDELLMDVDTNRAAALRDRFDQSIFSEDVQVEDVSRSRRQLGVYGPKASETRGERISERHRRRDPRGDAALCESPSGDEQRQRDCRAKR